MSVRSIRIQLERLMKIVRPHQHAHAVLKGFRYLTVYDSYAEAYNNPEEKRYFTSNDMPCLSGLFTGPE